MRTWMRLAPLAGLILAGGCGGPFGPCYEERIEVRLAGGVTFDGVTTPIASVDQVAPANFEDFELVRQIVIDGAALPRRLIWTATIFGEPFGVVSVWMPGNVRLGQVIPLRAIDGGGWGAPPLGGLTDGLVDFSFAGFDAATVQGTLTVETLPPLQVRLRFAATDTRGASRAVDLAAAFSYNRFRAACT